MTTFIAISTLTSDINFYSRLIQMRDDFGKPIFSCVSVQLSCADCIAEGKAETCRHLLHLVCFSLSLSLSFFNDLFPLL